MADVLGLQKTTIGDWRRGRLPVPPGVWADLAQVARKRRAELDGLDPRIQQAHEAAVTREASRRKG